MKSNKHQMKPLAFLFGILVLLQSCVVYQRHSVTTEEAMNTNSEVKVMTKTGEKLKFKHIGFEDDKYYGLKKIDNKRVKIDLDESNIESIKPKDKTMSTIMTIALPAGVIVGGFIILINAAADSTVSYILSD